MEDRDIWIEMEDRWKERQVRSMEGEAGKEYGRRAR